MGDSHQVRVLEIPIVFPAGVAPGAGKGAGNRLLLARDGRGRPILRGTALVGALRSAWARRRGIQDQRVDRPDDRLARWFGRALDGVQSLREESPLRAWDVVLGAEDGLGILRTHNSRDRHTGAVRKGGLFSLEALPPGTKGRLRLELWDESPEAQGFLAELLGFLAVGWVLGGNGARGVGRIELAGPALLRTYGLSDPADLARWLDDSWAERSGRRPASPGTPLAPTPPPEVLRIELTLAIPRGQDLCIGDGAGLEHVIEPQVVQGADGKQRYLLPGSSLRGALRAWVTRLAARELGAEAVADSVSRFQTDGVASGDELGWGRVDPDERRRRQEQLAEGREAPAKVVECPVLWLFGSLYSAGRIHVGDALSDVEAGDDRVQSRKHVAVDAITGGANDGFLFDHQAVRAGVSFEVTILVRDPDEREARWLASTLRALDMGLLRIGTSKSSGRLSLSGSLRATGPHAELLNSVHPSEVLQS